MVYRLRGLASVKNAAREARCGRAEEAFVLRGDASIAPFTVFTVP